LRPAAVDPKNQNTIRLIERLGFKIVPCPAWMGSSDVVGVLERPDDR